MTVTSALAGPYDRSNIFARILRGEMGAVTIFETDATLAFMDIFPQSDGHCLVIPKAVEAVGILDIAPDALARLAHDVQRLARAVAAALSPDGIRIAQFNGAAAGQTVFHIHFHVIPVYADAPIGVHAAGAKADPDRLAAQARAIASVLDHP